MNPGTVKQAETLQCRILLTCKIHGSVVFFYSKAGMKTMFMNSTQNNSVEIVCKFNDALNAADIDAMMALTTEDTIFENTSPTPDGERYSGKTQVRAFWEKFFRSSSSARIEIEEILTMGNRCVMLWIYNWTGESGEAGHIRGTDIYRLRDNLIAEKLSYVKG
jgi:ketosteroid isomerase-like protein